MSKELIGAAVFVFAVGNLAFIAWVMASNKWREAWTSHRTVVSLYTLGLAAVAMTLSLVQMLGWRP